MAFYCNGKKGMCDCDILCADCGFYDNTGGKKFQTNADRIRAMSDEELANIINEAAKAGWLKIGLSDVLGWLKQPAGED